MPVIRITRFVVQPADVELMLGRWLTRDATAEQADIVDER
ncbi:MAG: hypothetical protein JWL58_3499 [Streptosporangiaceae bacterium]|nr:hypothetical protein [Streptosporangiaceae bacterium]